MRQSISGFLAMKPQIDIKVDKVVQAGDLALVYSSWTMKGKGPDGNDMQMSGKGREVARRQRDGNWLFAIDDPMGGV